MGNWEDFVKTSKENKTHFYQNCHDAMGKELKALIEETISESMVEKEMEAWIQDGKYLDLRDITKKYEEKPDQLASILVRTRTYFCNIRNTRRSRIRVQEKFVLGSNQGVEATAFY